MLKEAIIVSATLCSIGNQEMTQENTYKFLDWQKEKDQELIDNLILDKNPTENSEITNKLPEVSIIKNAIANIKSRNSLPIRINYGKTKYKLPTEIDMKWDKLNPDTVFIKLTHTSKNTSETKKFNITPDFGNIKDININNGNINVTINKLGINLLKGNFDAKKITRLLLLIRTYKGDKNEDIPKTPLAKVQRVE